MWRNFAKTSTKYFLCTGKGIFWLNIGSLKTRREMWAVLSLVSTWMSGMPLKIIFQINLKSPSTSQNLSILKNFWSETQKWSKPSMISSSKSTSTLESRDRCKRREGKIERTSKNRENKKKSMILIRIFHLLEEVGTEINKINKKRAFQLRKWWKKGNLEIKN